MCHPVGDSGKSKICRVSEEEKNTRKGVDREVGGDGQPSGRYSTCIVSLVPTEGSMTAGEGENLTLDEIKLISGSTLLNIHNRLPLGKGIP